MDTLQGLGGVDTDAELAREQEQKLRQTELVAGTILSAKKKVAVYFIP